MSDEVNVAFGGLTLEVNLYDPLSADGLAAIAGYAAATEVSATDAEVAAAIALAAAASADYVAARGEAHLAAWLSAAGDGARLLVTADGEKTWLDDDPLTGDILTLAPLFGPGAALGQHGPTFDNSYSAPDAPLYPRLDPAGGIVHTPTTNFTLADGVIENASGVWSLDYIFSLPAVSETYASVAAMTADASAHGAGDVVFVTGPTIVAGAGTITNDAVMGTIIAATQPTGGYYVRDYTGWSHLGGLARLIVLLDTAGIGGGQDFLRVSIDSLGRLVFYGYDGTQQPTATTWYSDIVATPGVHSLRLDCDGAAIRLYFDGVERGAAYALLDFVPNAISINGNYRNDGGPTSPYYYTGGAVTQLALSITEGLDYTANRAVSDALAGLFGSPKLDWSPVAYVAVIDGQSEYSAPEGSTTGDGNRPDSVSNWNGLIARRTTNDPRGANPSQDFIPGVFVSKWRGGADSSKIAPLAYPQSDDGSGAASVQFTFSDQGETLDWGFAKQFRARTDAHLYFCGATIGGTTLAQIAAKSGTYLHSLKANAATVYGTNYRDLSNRQFLEIVDRCHERGQLVQVVLLANLQGLTDSATAGTAAAHATDLRQRWDEELSQLVDIAKPPLMLARAANYRGASPGTAVGTNEAAANYVDDEYRKLSAGKDTGHPIRAMTSEWYHKGTFIHPATLFARKSGEWLGDVTCRYAFEGKFVDPLQPLTVAIGTGGDAGKIVVTFNRPIASFTYVPTAPTTRQTGGYDTYGFVFVPTSGGRTISAAVTISGSTAKIPISGGGPIAGDRIGFLGTGALWGNIREATQRTGLYPDQDWGTNPLSDSDPAFDEGTLNDITEGAAAFTWVLT